MYNLKMVETGYEAMGDKPSILFLARLLEDSQVEFHLSDSMGRISQEDFNLVGYRFWLEPEVETKRPRVTLG